MLLSRDCNWTGTGNLCWKPLPVCNFSILNSKTAVSRTELRLTKCLVATKIPSKSVTFICVLCFNYNWPCYFFRKPAVKIPTISSTKCLMEAWKFSGIFCYLNFFINKGSLYLQNPYY